MPVDYRGATIEDLDLLPALTIYPTTPLHEALEMSYEHEYSYLPVVSPKNKRLLGYLTAEKLQKAAASTPANSNSLVKDHYIRFFSDSAATKEANGAAKSPKAYIPITILTPLETLESFFDKGEEFAVVTDKDGKFVLGVAVKDDLTKYIKSRPFLKA